MVCDILSVSRGQLSWVGPLPAPCPPPAYMPDGVGRVGKRESFDAVQALFRNSQNTGVLSALFQPRI